MTGLKQVSLFYQSKMSKNDEELVINYLKKNKNFFVKFPDLVKELNFYINDKSSEKVIDSRAPSPHGARNAIRPG